MASAMVAIGSALLVRRATNIEIEKKIITVILASMEPKSPLLPDTKNIIPIANTETIDAGTSAPRNITRLDSAISKSDLRIDSLISLRNGERKAKENGTCKQREPDGDKCGEHGRNRQHSSRKIEDNRRTLL